MDFLQLFDRLNHNDLGDTLVEVLISLAIISSILGGAFLVTRTSRLGVRDSQEHSEAVQILQGQIDNLRELSTDSTSPIYGANPFCIDSTGTVRQFGLSSLPPLNSDNFSAYPSQCQSWNNLYNIAGYFDSTNNIFNFSARWDSLRGNRDQVTLVYRIGPATAISLPPPPPTYVSCSDPGIMASPFYYNFFSYAATDNVVGSDGLSYTPLSFHVWYHHNPPKTFQHPLSINPYIVSPVIPSGTYNYWASGKDDSLNPGSSNRSLHYILRTSGGAFVAQTGDTDDNLVFQSASGKYESVTQGTFTLGSDVGQIQTEHATDDPTSTDDSVDAGCLALQPKT